MWWEGEEGEKREVTQAAESLPRLHARTHPAAADRSTTLPLQLYAEMYTYEETYIVNLHYEAARRIVA